MGESEYEKYEGGSGTVGMGGGGGRRSGGCKNVRKKER